MSYQHGVRVSEMATALLPPVEVDSAIPFIVGTAPINMSDTANVNEPVLCSSYAEAVAAFGYCPAQGESLKKFDYSISEFISSHFSLHSVSPVVIVNVLDPSNATHKTTATTSTISLNAVTGSATVEEQGILLDSVSILPDESDPTAYAASTYDLSFDANGYLVITSKKDGSGNFLIPTTDDLIFNATKLLPSGVTATDVIGTVSVAGVKSGFELIDEVFPRFRKIPSILVAPGYSKNPGVAAVMASKADSINGVFSAIALVDIPTDSVTQYSAVNAWKEQNNYTDPKQVACWPMISLDRTAYHMSTQLAGLMASVDSDNGDIPYVSPSNKQFKMNAAVLQNGAEVWLGQNEATYLNSCGVVTALNFMQGWVCWGNRTGAYPGNTDVKDSFIPVRRMFSWIGNTFVTTFWQRVDAPLNRRQIDVIVDSANIWLNGLAAQQVILGGRVEFLESENSKVDLMDGKAKFHVYITPPSPNREIDFVLEYDPDNLTTLFE